MGGLTQLGWEEEDVAKETLFWVVVVGGLLLDTGGRTSLHEKEQNRDYDDTLGFPDEDVPANSY